MLSPLARDGSVVVNLGGWDEAGGLKFPSYMEEYVYQCTGT